MALNYSISLMGNPSKPDDPKKAYAKAQINDELSLRELSKRVSSQTTVSRADVYAVIISTVENMVEALRAGDQVDFGELGKFRLQVSSKGAATAEEFTANNITGVNIQFVPGDDLKNLFEGMQFNPVPTRAAVRAVLKAQKAGETTVDITPPVRPAEDDEDDAEPGTGGGTQGGGSGTGDEDEDLFG